MVGVAQQNRRDMVYVESMRAAACTEFYGPHKTSKQLCGVGLPQCMRTKEREHTRCEQGMCARILWTSRSSVYLLWKVANCGALEMQGHSNAHPDNQQQHHGQEPALKHEPYVVEKQA